MRDDPYVVHWTGPAKRALGRVPEKVGTAAVEFIYSALAYDPHRVGRALQFELEGLHSSRRGDFRVVYRIDDPAHTVYIEVIGHRADVYRRS